MAISISKAIVLTVSIVFIMGLINYAMLQPQILVTNTGEIKTIGVDCDHDSINWGILEPGTITTHDIILTSTSNAPVTLDYQTGNWQPPEVEQYMVFAWNYTGQVLSPGEQIPVELSLSVLLEIVGSEITNFSFDITVYVTG